MLFVWLMSMISIFILFIGFIPYSRLHGSTQLGPNDDKSFAHLHKSVPRQNVTNENVNFIVHQESFLETECMFRSLFYTVSASNVFVISALYHFYVIIFMPLFMMNTL